MEGNTWKCSCLFSMFVKYLQAEADCETFLCASFLQMDFKAEITDSEKLYLKVLLVMMMEYVPPLNTSETYKSLLI